MLRRQRLCLQRWSQQSIAGVADNANKNRQEPITEQPQGQGIYHEDWGGVSRKNSNAPMKRGQAIDGKGLAISMEDMTTTPPEGYQIPLQALHGPGGSSDVPRKLGFDKQRVPERNTGLRIKRSKTRELYLSGMDTHKGMFDEETVPTPGAIPESQRKLPEPDQYMFGDIDESSAADSNKAVATSSTSNDGAVVAPDGTPSSLTTEGAAPVPPVEKKYQLYNEEAEAELRESRWAMAKGVVQPASPVHEVQSPFQRRHSSLEGEMKGEGWADTIEGRQRQMITGLGGGGGALDVPADSEVAVGEHGHVLNPYHPKHQKGKLIPFPGDNTGRKYKPESGDSESTMRVAPKTKKVVLNANELIDLADDEDLSDEGKQIKRARKDLDRQRAEELDAALGLSHDPQRRSLPRTHQDIEADKEPTFIEKMDMNIQGLKDRAGAAEGRDPFREWFFVTPETFKNPIAQVNYDAVNPKTRSYWNKLRGEVVPPDVHELPGYRLKNPRAGRWAKLKRIWTDIPIKDPYANMNILHTYYWGQWLGAAVFCSTLWFFHQWMVQVDMIRFYDEILGIDMLKIRMESHQAESNFLWMISLATWFFFMPVPVNTASIIITRLWRIARGRPLGPP